MENKSDKLRLILSMTIFGTIGLFVRSVSFPSAFIAFVRGALGSLFLVIVFIEARKKVSADELKRNLPLLIISGITIAFNWILLFQAYRYTSVSIATLCYYLAPVIVTAVSPVILKEKLPVIKILFVFLSLVGMYLISGVGGEGGGSFTGIVYGVAAAALYASVIIMNKFIKGLDAFEITIVQLLSAAVGVVPYILLTGGFSGINITGHDALILCIIGVIHTGVTYWLYFGSMKGLKAQTIAIYSYVDPVVAIILSALILKEHMGIREIIGAVLILGSTFASDMVRPGGKNE